MCMGHPEALPLNMAGSLSLFPGPFALTHKCFYPIVPQVKAIDMALSAVTFLRAFVIGI